MLSFCVTPAAPTATVEFVTGIRAARRADVLAAISTHARRQIAEEGASNLSLRAIARELGMVSSAIYRYVPSRDDLLTQLIIESYESLGEALEAAEASVGEAHPAQRWAAACRAARAWAHERPAEYGLIFGTPIPGYAAPPDTIGPATRYTLVLLRVLADLHTAGYTYPDIEDGDLRADLSDLIARTDYTIEPGALAIGLSAWTNIFGTISFELFGHFHNVINARDTFFDDVVSAQAKRLIAHPPR
jgi:AcrR family transcriptional regulator